MKYKTIGKEEKGVVISTFRPFQYIQGHIQLILNAQVFRH